MPTSDVELNSLIPEIDNSSLHRISRTKNIYILEQLLINPYKGKLEMFDYIGMTPLICAIDSDRIFNVKLLLKAGANPNNSSPLYSGESALHLAAQYNNVDLYKLLLSYGGDENLRDNLGMTSSEWLKQRNSGVRHKKK